MTILQHLNDIKETLTSRQVEELRETSIIPIGSRLLRAERLFLRMEENLSPFMFEVRFLMSFNDKLCEIFNIFS